MQKRPPLGFLVQKASYLMGALLWPSTVLQFVVLEEYFVAVLVAFLTIIAWVHTARWILGVDRPRVLKEPRR